MTARRIAVVGSGIAGLGAARLLTPHAQVTLFEAGDHFGGHAHTVDVKLDGHTHGVDTGFLVFNHRTYPLLRRFFDELGVDTAPSDMSFSVQSRRDGLEWSGSSLATVFAQKRNLLRPAFLRMLAEIVRFNRLATGIAQRNAESELSEDIGAFLDRHGFDQVFREWYFLPMIGCIWSCPTDQMLRFPVATMIRFCHNHGLIQVSDRPQWYTVRGGSRNYVARVIAGLHDARLRLPVRAVRRGPDGVTVHTDHGSERFDELVLACHTDQSLALLQDPSDAERDVLGAIRYQANRTVLHTDTALLPTRRRAWAAWNYEHVPGDPRQASVCLHYLIDRLQPLPFRTPVVVSLNPSREPSPAKVIDEWPVDHPVFDLAAIRAQQQLPSLQGRRNTWYAGAWTRYGFHEDGLMSAHAVADAMIARWRLEAAGVGTVGTQAGLEHEAAVA